MTEKEKSLWTELCHLSNKLKYLHKREISENDEKAFQRMSEILIKSLPNLEDPYSEIDKILYKDGTLQVDELEKECLIDTEKLLSIIDLHDFTHAYHHMVVVKNIVNQCFDNVFLRLVEIKGKTADWFLDGVITELLESKNIFQVCIGLKIFNSYLKVDGFAYGAEIDLCYAAFDLSHMTDLYSFQNRDEKEMARFVAKLAKNCYDLMEEKDDMLIYTSRIILEQILQGDPIGQNHIRALYEIIKSSRSCSEIFGDLCRYDLKHIIRNIVYSFLYYIRCFNKRYEELDEEMREIDKLIGQEFGGFSLEVVADDDIKNKSMLIKKNTLNKYFFYDDAMKTLSLLSFLYNCVEKYKNEKLQHFKLGVNFSHVTKFVVTLIHQCELNQKIDKPSWIMEKILNTCPFTVFGRDEEREKDIFMKLMNGEEIDEELIRLKDFMVKNKLSYEDKCYE